MASAPAVANVRRTERRLGCLNRRSIVAILLTVALLDRNATNISARMRQTPQQPPL
jgi:hypothetical protein